MGVHWPSTGAERKRSSGRRLVLGELKVGDGALGDVSGLAAHLEVADAFAAVPDQVHALEVEVAAVFRQKRALGLLKAPKDIEGFGEERPLYLVVLANHKPARSGLRATLGALRPTPHLDVRVVRAGLVGYGLYDAGLLTVEEACAVL